MRLAAVLAVLSVAVSASPRILLAAGALPDAARPFIWSDVLSTYVGRLSGGRVPYFDAFFEYPPIVGYIAGAFLRTTSDATAYLAVWAALSATVAGVVAVLLARATSPARAVLFWSLSPQLLLYGAANFDVLAAGAAVGGVLLLRGGRSRAGIVVLTAGALVKAFPAVGVPFELDRIRRTEGARAALAAAGAAALTAAAIATPSLVAPHPVTESAIFIGGLTNFDSAWGLVLAALGEVRLPGAEEIVAFVSTIGFAATYLYIVVRRPSEDPARLTLLGVLAVLLWTRLYSPQYSLWVVPLLALVPLSPRRFALLSIADVAVFATVYPLTLLEWPSGDVGREALFGILVAAIVVRHLALILMWRDARADRSIRARSRGARGPAPT